MINLQSTFGVENIYAGPGRLTPGSGTIFPPGGAKAGQMYYDASGFLPAGAGQTSAGGGGGLLSAITTGLETFLPKIFSTPPMLPGGGSVPVVRPPGSIVPMYGAPAKVMGAITKAAQQHPVLTAAGGAAATAGAAAIARRAIRGRVAQLPDGTVVHMRRRRRMNPCNIHALRRGLRRAHAFERIARKVLHFTSPHKTHGTAVFKKARKRR